MGIGALRRHYRLRGVKTSDKPDTTPRPRPDQSKDVDPGRADTRATKPTSPEQLIELMQDPAFLSSLSPEDKAAAENALADAKAAIERKAQAEKEAAVAKDKAEAEAQTAAEKAADKKSPKEPK